MAKKYGMTTILGIRTRDRDWGEAGRRSVQELIRAFGSRSAAKVKRRKQGRNYGQKLELIPCPFCGLEPRYEPAAEGHDVGHAWPHQIVHDCRKIGQTIVIRASNIGRPDTKAWVYHIWNRRAA